MATIYFCQYKNYYNRQAKVAGNVRMDYWDYIVDHESNVDFNPNDGIWAQQIWNCSLPEIADKIDYLLVCDEEDNIESRWYILEATRRRAMQYSLKLLRDVIADYRDVVINAPTFIEKATVGYGNPLLFNSEDMTFNQIKTREVPIWDKTECAWIVGYMASKVEQQTITTQLNRTYVAEYDSWEGVPFYNKIDNSGYINALNESSVSLQLRYGISLDGSNPTLFFTDFNENGFLGTGKVGVSGPGNPWNLSCNLNYGLPNELGGTVARQGAAAYAPVKVNFLTALYNQTGLVNSTELNEFFSLYSESGTIIKVGTKFYRVKRSNAGSRYLSIESGSSLINLFNGLINQMDVLSIYNSNNIGKSYRVNCYENKFRLTIEEVSAPRETLKVTIPGAASRNHLQDAPYDMFCIPYQPNGYTRYFTCTHAGGANQRKINSEAGLAISQKLVEALTTANIYDLQLLPYCPIPEAAYERGINLLTSEYNTEGYDFSIIEAGTGDNRTAENVIIWCKKSEFSAIREYNISISEPKIEAMCDMYRLVSPNYNSQFQFNHVKNEGVDYFEIECTYKPYSPYIHVAPNFKGLYGGDFNDARGLICSGDFSLPTLTDQWKQYEVNNKNYLNAFNRQIQNIEINNKYQRQSEVINAVTGAIGTGAQTGMMVGGTTANPALGVAAGVAGAGISAVGGIIDVSINDKLRTEALDYTKDQFGYTLGNIQAMPDVLNKVSAFNINNKVFPILEYYTCTDTEKQALRDKITYNGMTVMTIGTINDYIQPEESYIKGRVIRLEGLEGEYHLAVAIAEEIYKGVFI